MFRGFKNNVLMITSPAMHSQVVFPYLAAPLLIGQLKKAGYRASSLDLSVDFFKNISSIKFIDKTYKKIKEIEQKYYAQNEFKLKRMHRLYPYLRKLIKSKKELKQFQKKLIFDFVNFPFDYTIFRDYVSKGDYSFISHNKFCFNKDVNFYIPYLEEQIKKLPNNFDVICVSKFPDYDLNNILTLGALLKKKYKNKKIVLGGYWFSAIAQELKSHQEIFDKFCDYIMVGDGENAIVELMEHIEGKRGISQISNLLYRDENNNIIQNGEISKIDINNLAYPDYSGCDFSKYAHKTPAVSMSTSKGCYWGKCKFCTYKNRAFQLKTIKNAIEEIKHYVKKYGIKIISFTDDAIPPKYYEKLADEIIKNNIKINFDSFAIFDSNFNYEIFKKMKKAGLTLLVWGLETNSKKVFDIANKSGCFEKRAQILKDAKKAGIRNLVNVIQGLPGEKFEDLLKTVKFLYDNADYIDNLTLQHFQMRLGCEFAKNPEKYNIKITGKAVFSLYYDFNYLDCDISEKNSFIEFFNKLNTKGIEPDSKFIKFATGEYLKTFAPELL